ncbi:hypothetical protein BDV24DRAFT_169301 [Aspergillus arachidicola]|uniref:NDT80 domain-containing protein n=1 Tax=Aspergillus arachidicola TaxID=656916 RepID=A0A5N6XQZ5_9EURO|nr:hypothetical protein BDV24DRAFT_169301 [Aspergillus arachidicola]
MPYFSNPVMFSIAQRTHYHKSSSDKDILSYYAALVPENDNSMTIIQRDLPPPKCTLPGYKPRPHNKVLLHSPMHSKRQRSHIPVQSGSQLLTFSKPAYKFLLLDCSLRQTTLSLSAQLHGMFSLAKSSLSTSLAEDVLPQQGAEIISYRRNMFHVTGMVTLPRGLGYAMTDQGDCIPIHTRELSISVTESRAFEPVNLVSVPLKARVANITPLPGDSIHSSTTNDCSKLSKKQGPHPIPLDTVMGQDQGAGYVTLPVAWKRLQFCAALPRTVIGKSSNSTLS